MASYSLCPQLLHPPLKFVFPSLPSPLFSSGATFCPKANTEMKITCCNTGKDRKVVETLHPSTFVSMTLILQCFPKSRNQTLVKLLMKQIPIPVNLNNKMSTPVLSVLSYLKSLEEKFPQTHILILHEPSCSLENATGRYNANT